MIRSDWARASSYQKSCSKATARLKDACDAVAQETGNDTVPSRSIETEAVELADEWLFVWPAIGRAANTIARDVRVFIATIIEEYGATGDLDFWGMNSHEFPRLLPKRWLSGRVRVSYLPPTRLSGLVVSLTQASAALP